MLTNMCVLGSRKHFITLSHLILTTVCHTHKHIHAICPPMINCNILELNSPQKTGSSVHGILQARILEWVAISFSREIFPTQ